MKNLILAFLANCFLFYSGSQSVFAQSDLPRVEVGAHYTLLRFGEFDTTDSGVGGRLTFNLTNSFAVEGEFNFFPEKRRHFIEPFYINSQRYQGVFGAKYGVRKDKFGIFAKLRPGFIRFGEGLLDPSIQTLVEVPNTFKSTEFVLDWGGVFELYPSRHTVLRLDIGDTIIFFGNSTVSNNPSFTSHNVQLNMGFGFRF